MILLRDNNGSFGFHSKQVLNIWQDGEFIKIWLKNGVEVYATAPSKRVADLIVGDIWSEEKVSYKLDEVVIKN